VRFFERLFRSSADSAEEVPLAPDPTDSPMPQRPAALPPRDERLYEVKPGDTLEGIARDVYGDRQAWRRIAEANRMSLGDPPVLYPGLLLNLP
jgi:nucleoid-associated protein YgaU